MNASSKRFGPGWKSGAFALGIFLHASAVYSFQEGPERLAFDKYSLFQGSPEVPTAALCSFLKSFSDKDPVLTVVNRLIQDLASESFVKRNNAHRDVVGLGIGALPHLENHLRSENLELSRRTMLILKELRGTVDWSVTSHVLEHLLQRTATNDIISTLVTYLPYAPNEFEQREIWKSLYESFNQKRISPERILPFLSDPLAPRRAVSGFLLASFGKGEHLKNAEKLLDDVDPWVRLRT